MGGSFLVKESDFVPKDCENVHRSYSATTGDTRVGRKGTLVNTTIDWYYDDKNTKSRRS
jgi:hypothetical protein